MVGRQEEFLLEWKVVFDDSFVVSRDEASLEDQHLLRQVMEDHSAELWKVELLVTYTSLVQLRFSSACINLYL